MLNKKDLLDTSLKNLEVHFEQLEAIKLDENDDVTRDNVKVVKQLILKLSKAMSGYISTGSSSIAALEHIKL